VRYYIVTTAKFKDECLSYLTYGATQSNWLANINVGDIIFLSQFNPKSQNLFGPLQVTQGLFHNKDIIYPQQRYFYRIQFKPIGTIRIIEETDLYLNGIQSSKIASHIRIINLIQQNKHLHCISLTNDEGDAIQATFDHFGFNYSPVQESTLINDMIHIDCEYICRKNKLDKKNYFPSESDLESYIILSLKNDKSEEYKSVNTLLNKYENNDLQFSEIYNQFIFGNAYPSDIVILNKTNINLFELKKDELTNNVIPQVEKEIRKHLYYSLFSERIKSKDIQRFNFYLIYFKNSGNERLKSLISGKYKQQCNRMQALRENTITFIEYRFVNNKLILEEV